MKTFSKLIAIAAAFGLAPAAAFAAASAPAPTANAAAPAAAAGEEAATNEAAPAAAVPRTAPEAGMGQPDGRMLLQDQVTPIGVEASWFHNAILMPLITIISLVVLGCSAG